jgi:small subunit ribosomal protein S17
MSEQRTRVRPTRVGIVVSDKMDKTALVAVETPLKHPRYKKYVRRTTKFMVHDERNECCVGDKVLIVQDRPRSKHKSWRLRRVVDRPVVARGTGVSAERPELEELAKERAALKEAKQAEAKAAEEEAAKAPEDAGEGSGDGAEDEG